MIHQRCQSFVSIGEFGQVYKGYLKTRYRSDVVAVKTLRGEKLLSSNYSAVELMRHSLYTVEPPKYNECIGTANFFYYLKVFFI